jgi:hypothetical protein
MTCALQVNGSPVEMIQPELMRMKIIEPVLLVSAPPSSRLFRARTHASDSERRHTEGGDFSPGRTCSGGRELAR